MTVFCVHLIIDQPQTGASGVVCQGRRHGPSIKYKITPCWVTILQPPGGPPCWTSPLAFGLIADDKRAYSAHETKPRNIFQSSANLVSMSFLFYRLPTGPAKYAIDISGAFFCINLLKLHNIHSHTVRYIT
jgi:hypothetical protein